MAVDEHKNNLPKEDKILKLPTPDINPIQEILTRYQRRLLAQIRTDKSPFVFAEKHKINPIVNPSPLCPLCSDLPHNTIHLFQCIQIPTTLTPFMDKYLRGGGAARNLAVGPG